MNEWIEFYFHVRGYVYVYFIVYQRKKAKKKLLMKIISNKREQYPIDLARNEWPTRLIKTNDATCGRWKLTTTKKSTTTKNNTDPTLKYVRRKKTPESFLTSQYHGKCLYSFTICRKHWVSRIITTNYCNTSTVATLDLCCSLSVLLRATMCMCPLCIHVQLL